jgi:hypothetical protein
MFAVWISFIVFLVAILVQMYVYTDTTATTTTTTIIPTDHFHMLPEYRTYESLGPIPPMDTDPKIYHVHIASDNHRILQQQQQQEKEEDAWIQPSIITPEMQEEYERDGVVCIRGLIPPDLLQRLDIESNILVQEEQQQKNRTPPRRRRGGTQFHTVTHSAWLRPTALSTTTTTTSTSTTNATTTIESTLPSRNAFMDVALWSHVSTVAAALLQYHRSTNSHSSSKNSNNNETVRMIRDIFLAKDDDPYICGWHVDDMGFWPVTPDSSMGINAWIALDDMDHDNIDSSTTTTTMTGGGGFALAVQSHTAPWKDVAYHATGIPTTNTFPQPNGYQNVSHMFQQRTGYGGTCNIQQVAPHIHRRLEETLRIYPVRKGDVIFHTQRLFHRTVPIRQPDSSQSRVVHTDDNNVHHQHRNHPHSIPNQQPPPPPPRIYRRYSIRYGFGSTSIIPPGYGTELSVLYNASYGGLSATEICEQDHGTPWYPQAYPHLDVTRTRTTTTTASSSSSVSRTDFHQQLHDLIQYKLPIALQRQQSRKQEMRPYLQQLAQEQYRRSTMGQ